MYGAWISKKEIIPVDCYEAHEDIALDIIHNALKTKPGHLTPNKYSIYRVMLRLGYVRVLYIKGTRNYFVNYYFKGKFSKFQKEAISDASGIEVNYIYNRHKEIVYAMNEKLDRINEVSRFDIL